MAGTQTGSTAEKIAQSSLTRRQCPKPASSLLSKYDPQGVHNTEPMGLEEKKNSLFIPVYCLSKRGHHSVGVLPTILKEAWAG